MALDGKPKVIKKADVPQRRIRPEVTRQLLLDEKSRLAKRINVINRIVKELPTNG